MRLLRFAFVSVFLLSTACSETTKPVKPVVYGYGYPFPNNDTPTDAMIRFVQSYKYKAFAEYQGMLTGDFTYEFSSMTDPTLVQRYSTGWFKNDEIETTSHLFAGYTPPGGQTTEPASSISIRFALLTPSDDDAPGVNPMTHKVLATRVDGSVTVPQPGGPSCTYVIFNNQEVFYLVRGDAAANLDSTQPADINHWYIYRWVDLTAMAATAADSSAQSDTITWGALKNMYR